MSDKQFTFFELHFHEDLQFGPRSLGTDTRDGGSESGGATTDSGSGEFAAPTEDGEPTSGPSVLGPLLGLGVLAGLAYAAKKLLAGVDAEGLDALDDIEADAEETAEELQDEAEDSVPIEITEPEAEGGSGLGLAVAAAVGLLVVLAVVARKLLGGSEEIVVEE